MVIHLFKEKLLIDTTCIFYLDIRHCILCNKIAKYECKVCSETELFAKSLVNISYCEGCYDLFHSSTDRQFHTKSLTKFSYGHENVTKSHDDLCHIPRIRLNLFAVICISISHYVAFVRCGNNKDSEWCFFDSMCDRKGRSNLIVLFNGKQYYC